jgi:hypothetical protein
MPLNARLDVVNCNVTDRPMPYLISHHRYSLCYSTTNALRERVRGGGTPQNEGEEISPESCSELAGCCVVCSIERACDVCVLIYFRQSTMYTAK